jgi:2-polyprenyl-6-methoxyphenol hydroxylase-like FAD-dependent oxidoreductase
MRPFDDEPRTMLSASRDLIEWVTRRLVTDTPQVIVRSGLEATGLVVAEPSSGTVGRVRGIDVRPRAATSPEPTETIVADLVVDASGRRSHAPDWLAAAGYERPEETTVDAELAYATRLYRRSGDDEAGGWKAVFLQARPPDTRRMAVLFPIEGDRWMLTVAGTNGDVPPTDERGFLEFTQGMRSPVIADIIDRLEPMSPIVGYRRTENRRHFESLRMPDGFVVVGDATSAFNPVYGQGMSAAALTAEALDRCLGQHLARHDSVVSVSSQAQRAVAKANAGAWMVAIGEDLRYPETRGGKVGVTDRLIRCYLDRVVAAAAVDPVVNAAFFDVVALLAAPTSLMRPALVARVLGRRHETPDSELCPAPRPLVPAREPA